MSSSAKKKRRLMNDSGASCPKKLKTAEAVIEIPDDSDDEENGKFPFSNDDKHHDNNKTLTEDTLEWVASIVVEKMKKTDLAVYHSNSKETALSRYKSKLQMCGLKVLKKPQLMAVWEQLKHELQEVTLASPPLKRDNQDKWKAHVEKCLWLLPQPKKMQKKKATTTAKIKEPTEILELQNDGSFQLVKTNLVVIDSIGNEQDAAFAREVAAAIPIPSGKSLREIREAQRQAWLHSNGRAGKALARKLQAEQDAFRPKGDTFDVLAEYRQTIQETLKKQAHQLKITHVQPNLHSQVGTRLYNRFLKAWQRVQDQTVAMVFHGTPEANVEAICKEGLDPRRRRGQSMGPGEYFARDASLSMSYCQGGRKMLVFAVLTDRSGLTADQGGVVVIHKPQHQLPLFVVTFENNYHLGMPTLTMPLPNMQRQLQSGLQGMLPGMNHVQYAFQGQGHRLGGNRNSNRRHRNGGSSLHRGAFRGGGYRLGG